MSRTEDNKIIEAFFKSPTGEHQRFTAFLVSLIKRLQIQSEEGQDDIAPKMELLVEECFGPYFEKQATAQALYKLQHALTQFDHITNRNIGTSEHKGALDALSAIMMYLKKVKLEKLFDLCEKQVKNTRHDSPERKREILSFLCFEDITRHEKKCAFYDCLHDKQNPIGELYDQYDARTRQYLEQQIEYYVETQRPLEKTLRKLELGMQRYLSHLVDRIKKLNHSLNRYNIKAIPMTANYRDSFYTLEATLKPGQQKNNDNLDLMIQKLSRVQELRIILSTQFSPPPLKQRLHAFANEFTKPDTLALLSQKNNTQGQKILRVILILVTGILPGIIGLMLYKKRFAFWRARGDVLCRSTKAHLDEKELTQVSLNDR